MKLNHPVIDVQALSLGFDKPLCADLTFSLKEGAKVRIDGRSGAGKSTLLRCLLGFVRPLSGQVTIFDRRLTRDTVWSLRSRMAYVTQEPDLGTGPVKDTILRPFAYKTNAHLHPTDKDVLYWCDHFFLSQTLLAQGPRSLGRAVRLDQGAAKDAGALHRLRRGQMP